MDINLIWSKLNKLETIVQKLAEKEEYTKRKAITQQDFKTFYNRVKTELPQDGVTPFRIWINTDYEKDLKHKVLYPNYETGAWFTIGEPEDIPIGFTQMNTDFDIDCAICGNFLKSTPFEIQVKKEK